MTDGRGYSTSEIAKRLGVSTAYVRSQIDDGRLLSHGSGHRHFLHRSDIYRWLLSESWPADKIRGLFPLPGPLATVGLRMAFKQATSLEYPRHFEGAFDLGRSVSEVSPWGIVVDLPGIGTSTALVEFSNYSKLADRSVLIGLIGDGGVGASEVFDAVIPDSLPMGKIAQRIRAVRPWGR